MTDTHTHLYFSSFGEGYEDAIERSLQSGVSMMILPGVDIPSIGSIRECHAKYPGCTKMSMGLHPTEVKEDWKEVLEIMEKELSSGEYCAVGEIGIDLHWEKDRLKEQKEVFKRLLQVSEDLKLPVIIHSRDALRDTLDVIEEVNPTVPLIFHSFTGSVEDVKSIREVCDPYFGINGVVTYKNAPELRKALHEIGINKILLETDSPYLTPVPHRGKKNETSYLGFIRDKISEELGLTSETVEEITDNNARAIFK